MAVVGADTHQTLSGVATGDVSLLEEVLGLREAQKEANGLDARTFALVKIAALIALVDALLALVMGWCDWRVILVAAVTIAVALNVLLTPGVPTSRRIICRPVAPMTMGTSFGRRSWCT